MKKTLLRGAALAACAVRHPTWAEAHLQNLVHDRRERQTNRLAQSTASVAVSEALVALTGAAPADVDEILRTVPKPSGPSSSVLSGNPNASGELIAMLYGICRLLRPRVVVETGVAHGFTSAAILDALTANGAGTLISIDLPQLHPRAHRLIGAAVAPRLRDRWQLRLGPAARLLPRVVRESGGIDVFVQDAAHTLAGQLAEYRAAWPGIRPGGLVVSDDVRLAFELFAAETGAEPIYVNQPPKLPIGALRKPSAGTLAAPSVAAA